MRTKKRYEFKNKNDMQGWINTSGASHIENMNDIFVKPIKWGLFTWNKENNYPIEKAILFCKTETFHKDYVCRPVSFL